MADSPPRVFVSYSHDSPAHQDRVLALVDRLRADGVDAQVDEAEPAPPEGWQRWMQRQIEDADFVVCVCTAAWCRRFEGREEAGKGRGVTWEGHLIQATLYRDGARNTKFVPARFDDAPEDVVPLVLRAWTHYRLDEEYERMLRHLTGQPAWVPAAVGPACAPGARTPMSGCPSVRAFRRMGHGSFRASPLRPRPQFRPPAAEV